jgi:hypothetical protein
MGEMVAPNGALTRFDVDSDSMTVLRNDTRLVSINNFVEPPMTCLQQVTFRLFGRGTTS